VFIGFSIFGVYIYGYVAIVRYVPVAHSWLLLYLYVFYGTLGAVGIGGLTAVTLGVLFISPLRTSITSLTKALVEQLGEIFPSAGLNALTKSMIIHSRLGRVPHT
jgi:hypothetical protein